MHKKIQTAISWCLKKKIKIYVKPISKGYKSKVKIHINISGKEQIGKETYYQDIKLSEKIQELYLHMYNTYK
tara:strand:- start:1776 stop:1991 length:216 start_codon:yes stop_codon:yes gene_type:complete